jgi:hypothetical protein
MDANEQALLDKEPVAPEAGRGSNSGTTVIKANLAPGIVRHAMLCDGKARDKFAAAAKEFEVNQGDLLEAFVALLGNASVKSAITIYLKEHGKRRLMKGPDPTVKSALKKVDPKALEAFLKAQGAL